MYLLELKRWRVSEEHTRVEKLLIVPTGIETKKASASVVFPVLLIVILFLYFILLESSPVKGTLGKLSMGIEIVNRDGTGQTIGKSCIRLLLNILLGGEFSDNEHDNFFHKIPSMCF